MESQQEFEELVSWIRSHGGGVDAIHVPVRFPEGEVGVAASRHISKRELVMAIPTKLVISVDTALKSELKPFYNKHKHIFHPDVEEDAEFNILSVFLFSEYLKGKESFYSPYLKCLPKDGFLLMSEDTQVNKLGFLVEEINCLKEQLRGSSVLIMKAMRAEEVFASLIGKRDETQLEGLLGLCFNLVMTRCFGYSMPSTSLVPLMDMMNHSDRENTTHYVVNTRLERNGEPHNNYKLKSNKLNLSLLGLETVPTNESKEGPDLGQKHRNAMGNSTQQNISKLLQGQRPIEWELSSDSEDNDTDEQEKEKQQELAQNLRKREIQARRNSRNTPIINTVHSNTKKSTNKEGFVSLGDSSEESSSSHTDSSSISDEEFKWFDSQDSNFIVATATKQIQQGQQLHTSYGRRTNRFLYTWYGFCLHHNKYDSVPLRLAIEYPSNTPLAQLAKRGIVTTISSKYFPIQQQGKKYSKEFRLKLNRLAVGLVNYSRYYLRRYLGDVQNYQIPGSYGHQITVLQFVLSVVVEIKDRLQLKSSVSGLFNQRMLDGYSRILQKQQALIQQAIICARKLKEGVRVEEVVEGVNQQLLNQIGSYFQDLIDFGY